MTTISPGFRVGTRTFSVWRSVAAEIVPWHADLTDDAIEAAVVQQVVEHDVAGRHPERNVGADQAVHHVVVDEIDFNRTFRLRVSEEKHIEAGGPLVN